MRFARRFVAILPVAALFMGLQVAAPAAACACGAPAPLPGADLEVNQERAIISWAADGSEQIDLRLGMIGSEDETGLIFPTPAPATVTAGDTQDFIDLEEWIAPKITYENDPWGSDGGETGGAPGGAPEVLDEVVLGPVTATTLAASDAQGLTDWLNTNGYTIREAVSEKLVDYVERGWYFVALKLTADEAFDGSLDPIRFTFDTDELVYPMDLSQAAESVQEVRLYVLDEHRAQLAPLRSPGSPYAQSSTYWAGQPPAALAERGPYLTVLDLYLSDPATQALDALVTRAPDDGTVTQDRVVSRPMSILGVPIGVLAILGGAILVVVAFLVVRGVRNARGAQRRPARS